MASYSKTGGMVIGTGDLSELALGWATYNGDHMSMYAVNASVPKTLVRHLVRYYADTCGDEALEAVLLDVLDTPVHRNFYRRRTERFPRRRKIWSDLTNYMIFICIICSVLAMRRQRFTVWRKLLLWELMMMKPF